MTVTASTAGPTTPAANSVGTISISGKTFSFEDVSRLIVRLQLIPALKNVTLTSADETQQAVGSQPSVKDFTISATVVQPELPGALPLTDVEVQGQ